MRLKAILPAILAVMVLFSSSAGAVCQIACGGAGAVSACTATQPAQAPMAGMQHCSMCKPARPGATAQSSNDLACVCAQQSAVPGYLVQDAAQTFVSPDANAAAIPLGPQPLRPARSETPPVRISSPVSLHTTLRV